MTTPLDTVREALDILEIMFRQLETIHDNTGYVDNHDFVGIDANLDNVRAAIKGMKAAVAALEAQLANMVPIEDDAILNNLGDLKEPWDKIRPYVNDTPALISLLYDLDLMPEQIHVRRNFVRMMQIAAWHKHRTSKPESVRDLIAVLKPYLPRPLHTMDVNNEKLYEDNRSALALKILDHLGIPHDQQPTKGE